MGKRHILGNLRRETKKKSAGAAVLAVCLVLLVVLSGAVIGRYQRRLRSDSAVRAKEFYFTSNLLDGGTHTLAPGSTEVTFTLGNHADELRCSEVDIVYTIAATSSNGIAATVKNSEGKATGTLVASDTPADAEITVSGLQAGTYTVTAVGTGGYEKTLTATIVVPEETAQIYQHQDKVPGEYILLTVWNEGDEAEEVTITYTGIPDNTNPNMAAWKRGGETAEEKVVVKIAPRSSSVFRFFSGTITVTDTGSNPVKVKDPA